MTDRNLVCRSCGAKIMWVQTEKGRRMPVDDEPTDQGNITLVRRVDNIPLAYVLAASEIAMMSMAERRKLFTSHFATCPSADRWRKKR